jgi:hypothetical protein
MGMFLRSGSWITLTNSGQLDCRSDPKLKVLSTERISYNSLSNTFSSAIGHPELELHHLMCTKNVTRTNNGHGSGSRYGPDF